MEAEKITKKQKKVWISLTGYRILYEFKSILESPKTIDELIDIVENNPIIGKRISKDTVRFDINTLRSAGCDISRPTKANNYKYFIVSHPFKLNIYPDELNVLLEFRKELAADLSLDDIFILNSLYEKISFLTFDVEQIGLIKNTKLLSDINPNILKELSKLIEKRVQFVYKSPQYGEENIDAIPVKIIYENNKVYLAAYNYKYKCNSYFEVSKILKIVTTSLQRQIVPSSGFQVVYEVIGESVKDFVPNSYEKIIKQEFNKLVIEADVTNEFMFTQRLLLLGRNFKIISPVFFKENLINKIKLIQKRYKKV